MFSPFFTPCGRREPRRPESTSKMSPGPPPPPPSCSPSSPYRSYVSRFCSLPRTSKAFWMSLNFSGSPPLSGWFFTASLRYALRISSADAPFSTPRSLYSFVGHADITFFEFHVHGGLRERG